MTARSRARGTAIQAYLGLGPARRRLAGLGRLLSGGRRCLDFYYRADDPYSHLLAQVLPRMLEADALELRLLPVTAASAGAQPEPQKLARYSIRDAVLLADAYGLSFPKTAETPSPDRVRRAHAVLLRDRPPQEQLRLAAELGEALWGQDGRRLAGIVAEHGTVSGERVDPMLEGNQARLERAGHYQSGMLHYAGEWYWGLDRLHYLQERLRAEGLQAQLGLAPAPSPELLRSLCPAPAPGMALDFYFSFRSPYSYLGLQQLAGRIERWPLELRLRPVLPMVMRGLQVPKAKRMYIVKDAKREADRLGIEFGRISDPLGPGIAQCMQVFFRAAEPRGLGLAFALSALRGIWAEGRDVADLGDLQRISERVGIGPAEVRESLQDRRWEAQVARNREDLSELGLWGVPSFQLGGFSAWGQDRLFWLEAALEQAFGES